MITSLRQYILSVITASLICAILSEIAGKGTGKEAIRSLCGLFLAASIFSPVSFRNHLNLRKLYADISDDAQAIIASGKAMAADAESAIIKEKTEAYIEDKATQWNAVLEAEVSLDDNAVPCSAELRGSVEQNIKENLESWITSEFGITKENLTWTG